MPVQLSVVTPAHPLVETDADHVLLPGEEGEFGVLPEHERFLTSLLPGVLEYTAGGETQRIAVSGGFAEVTGERVTVLVPAAERAEGIDRERAETALVRAEQALREIGSEAATEQRAQHEAEVARSRARLKASE